MAQLMSEHVIRLIGNDQDEDEVACVSCALRDRACVIICRYRCKLVEESASDFFEAFCRVRLRLEQENLSPFCYGASLNVYPSGMGRDMGLGMMAYRLTPGKAPERSDLVNIFDDCPDLIPATVAEQKEHWHEWLKSRGYS